MAKDSREISPRVVRPPSQLSSEGWLCLMANQTLSAEMCCAHDCQGPSMRNGIHKAAKESLKTTNALLPPLSAIVQDPIPVTIKKLTQDSLAYGFPVGNILLSLSSNMELLFICSTWGLQQSFSLLHGLQ